MSVSTAKIRVCFLGDRDKEITEERAMTLEEAMITVWREALVEGKAAVQFLDVSGKVVSEFSG